MGALKGIIAISLLLVLALCGQAVRVFRRENADFHPHRGPVARPAPEADLEGLRDVSFEMSGGATLRGWWLPSRNAAAVILTHGSGANRAQLLPEARILARHGYGVLLFDWPGHGESGGSVALGEPERRALESAVDFVAAQPGVDAKRIGALGFSVGGAIVAQVAARDSRVRAVVLEGTYANANELNRFAYGRLMQWPARLAGFLAGTNGVEPVDAVPALRPRPVLMITGTADQTVPSSMVKQLFDAAGEPKQFWIVVGAGHGGYDRVAPAEYRERLERFFDAALRA
jgi:alpha-beta hydrolase superfamily lysophospholipase